MPFGPSRSAPPETSGTHPPKLLQPSATRRSQTSTERLSNAVCTCPARSRPQGHPPGGNNQSEEAGKLEKGKARRRREKQPPPQPEEKMRGWGNPLQETAPAAEEERAAARHQPAETPGGDPRERTQLGEKRDHPGGTPLPAGLRSENTERPSWQRKNSHATASDERRRASSWRRPRDDYLLT